MALVRASTAAAARALDTGSVANQTRWAPAGAARENVFGTLADADDKDTNAFFFTQKPDVLDGYLEPAANLAMHMGLDCMWDEWTRAALRSVLQTKDVLAKRMVWLAFLAHLPQVADWFVAHGPPNARAWVEHVKTELDVFCLGQTKTDATEDAAAQANPPDRKRQKRTLSAADKKDAANAAVPVCSIYETPADFVASMTAYFLAL
jgi:hypothetical protein